MLRFQRIPVNINFWFAGLRWPRAGRGPPGDASVCRPDGPAVRTPGGPGPDEGGLGQRLCGAARGPGAAGARGFLGAPRLGAELNSPSCPVELHPRLTSPWSPHARHAARLSAPATPGGRRRWSELWLQATGLKSGLVVLWLNSPEGSFAQMMVGSVLPVYRNSECIPIFHCCSWTTRSRPAQWQKPFSCWNVRI